jgi:hypothetical protein
MPAKRISSLLNLPKNREDPKITIPQEAPRRSSEQLHSPSQRSISSVSKRLSRALQDRPPSGEHLLSPSNDSGFQSPPSGSRRTSLFVPGTTPPEASHNHDDSAQQSHTSLRRSSASPTLGGDGAVASAIAHGGSKRLSWLPGRSRSNSRIENPTGPSAYTLSSNGSYPYDTSPLLQAAKVRHSYRFECGAKAEAFAFFTHRSLMLI